MNTFQLETIFAGRRGFLGVYPSDKVFPPNLTRRPQCLIINLDSSDLPGSHWVAVCLYKIKNNKVLEYFDSYGTKSPRFKIPRGWIIRHSLIPLQSPLSIVCGHYCVYFIDRRLCGISYISIIEQLSKMDNPDTHVEHYVNLTYDTTSWRVV